MNLLHGYGVIFLEKKDFKIPTFMLYCNGMVKGATFSVMDITQDSGSWDGGSIPSRWIETIKKAYWIRLFLLLKRSVADL